MAAKAGPGRLGRFAVAAFAALRLPCGTQFHGLGAELTALASLSSFRQTAPSQMWMRALRAAMKLPFLSATEARPTLPEPTFAPTAVAFGGKPPLRA